MKAIQFTPWEPTGSVDPNGEEIYKGDHVSIHNDGSVVVINKHKDTWDPKDIHVLVELLCYVSPSAS